MELVAKTIICNYQLYDFYIDFLDLNYFKSSEKDITINEFYKKTSGWLEKIKTDLRKQIMN